MLMDQLPEDVLAMAMSRLCVVDVLACRLVCKRLAGLALHPDVWRHRSLDVDGYSKSARTECCRVLRLAPCLREISTSVTTALSCRHADLRTTSCAARVLSIAVDMGGKCGPEEATKAVQVIKQQEALGRLRAVSLVFWQTLLEKTTGTLLTEDTTDLLLGALASTPGLEAITLTVESRCRGQFGPTLGQRGTITPSLKSFSCDVLPWTVAFCNYMLAGHAATLEVVDLESDDLCPIDAALSPFHLLAGMPNLRQLTSGVMPGLGEVAACESLRSLKLTVVYFNADTAPGALELLRSAHQLRSLYLFFLYDDDEDDLVIEGKFAADLIRALASSGRSQVEMLTIEVERACLRLDQLHFALPRLPALRRLVMNVDPDGLLRGITPLTAPSLRSLQIRLYWSKKNVCDVCFHELLHSEKLQLLMSRNPLLHVELQYLICCSPDTVCEFCMLGCHKDLRGFKLVGIFAHSKDVCPSPEAHATIGSCYWVHIDDV